MKKQIRVSLLVQYLAFGSLALTPWIIPFVSLERWFIPAILAGLFAAAGGVATLWHNLIEEA